MLPLVLKKESSDPIQILCLGAHPDDIEIGCGGTVLTLLSRYQHLEFHWVVFSADAERGREARESANLFLQGAKQKNILVKNFRDGFFPYVGAEIKEFFEVLKRQVDPDLILTHYRQDLHQDHRIIAELTWNTYRYHLILEYEIPKYDGDLGSPNCFIPLDDLACKKKLQWLLSVFQTQRNKDWFTEETFLGLMRIRGVEAGGPYRHAEAFYARKLLLNP
jgi:LmbE family N-acetylglucosaminyl deacetylase